MSESDAPRYTWLVEYETPEDAPSAHWEMKALGGTVVAVQFSDALAEIDELQEKLSAAIARAEAAEKEHNDAHAACIRNLNRAEKAEAERDTLRAELDRLTTAAQEYVEAMRVVSTELPDKMRALVAAIPTPKEAT